MLSFQTACTFGAGSEPASGAEAVIVGKALYEGKITLEQALSA